MNLKTAEASPSPARLPVPAHTRLPTTPLSKTLSSRPAAFSGASTARIDIARRIIDPTATEPTQRLSTIYSVSIENGLAVGEGKGFVLKPYDMVQVRTSPGYEAQEFVSVTGEVLFGGNFALEKRNERISDVVRRARRHS